MVENEKAVGMRLTFRKPPLLKCFSNQFLFYLNASVANTAYSTWAGMSPAPVSALPPERFIINVVGHELAVIAAGQPVLPAVSVQRFR